MHRDLINMNITLLAFIPCQSRGLKLGLVMMRMTVMVKTVRKIPAQLMRMPESVSCSAPASPVSAVAASPATTVRPVKVWSGRY